MPPSIHYMPKVCDNTKFMSGQYQDVSGHLETHLCWAIGQSEKKEKQTVIFFVLHAIRTHCLFNIL
jgi:hypothetical protein